MVAIEDGKTREAEPVGRTHSFRRNFAVGLAAVVIGVVSVWVPTNLFAADSGAGHQATQIRGSLMGEHLDSIWASGLAQREANREREANRAFMRAWEMRGAAMANHLDVLIETGIDQQRAMGGR